MDDPDKSRESRNSPTHSPPFLLTTSSTPRPPSPVTPSTSLEARIDLGDIVQAANSSWENLKSLVTKLPDDKRKQYLSFHSKPSSSDTLHSHPVTKPGKTWNATFQMQCLEQFPWLSYSSICRYCVFSFHKSPVKGRH